MRPPVAGQLGRALLVRGRRLVGPATIELRLGPADEAALPRWAPGAHIDLVLPGGLVRPYSLCGDPYDATSWRVLVRRRTDGGASAYLHDRLRVGDIVHARGPRDRFGLVGAGRYLFLASGVGIAPLLPMARWVDAARIFPWTLLHLDHRDSVLADEVRSLGAGADLASDLDAVAEAVMAAADGTAVYACGSARFVDAVTGLTAGRPGLTLHRQQFDGRPSGPGETPGCELVLARRGDRIRVPANTPLLEALIDAGVDVPASCGSGICGACIVPVLHGAVRHRDSVLTDTERASGRHVVACVSAAAGGRLVLDL
ncbi:PDR/VanB family oxidoreductase [Actinoplanes aureus]|uniref:Oxidoreductase n=1 Tax=Actinoplanes aureus TaxID=2792083 RepID=A0A931G3F5_9ACTN|nr:PDR/VanB family oxidoreductase [Actinoplanes aureus]MBG0566971.1 oxidoreductase [Actinoplanes aureus]